MPELALLVVGLGVLGIVVLAPVLRARTDPASRG